MKPPQNASLPPSAEWALEPLSGDKEKTSPQASAQLPEQTSSAAQRVTTSVVLPYPSTAEAQARLASSPLRAARGLGADSTEPERRLNASTDWAGLAAELEKLATPAPADVEDAKPTSPAVAQLPDTTSGWRIEKEEGEDDFAEDEPVSERSMSERDAFEMLAVGSQKKATTSKPLSRQWRPVAIATFHDFQLQVATGTVFLRWLTSLLLLACSLGLAWPWVRQRHLTARYRELTLGEYSFAFAAPVSALVIGWVLTLVAVAAIGTAGWHFHWQAEALLPQYRWYFAGGVGALALVFVPLVLRQRWLFVARYSRFRDCHFELMVSPGRWWLAWFGHLVAVLASAGLLLPWAVLNWRKFVINHVAVGGDLCRCVLSGRLVMRFLLRLWLGVAVAGAVVAGLYLWQPLAAEVAAPVVVIMLWTLWRVSSRNLLLNQCELDDMRLLSSVRYWELLGVYVSNLLLVVVTAGLALPVASIRARRFFARHTTLAARDFDASIAVAAEASRTARRMESGGVWPLFW